MADEADEENNDERSYSETSGNQRAVQPGG